MRTRSATRCAKSVLSTSMSVGRSTSPTGLPTSNAGMPRRRGGTIAERAAGYSSALCSKSRASSAARSKRSAWISFDLLGFLAAAAGECHGLDRGEATPQPGDGVWHREPGARLNRDRASDVERRGALGCLRRPGRRGDLPRAHSVAGVTGTVRPLQTQRRLNPDLRWPTLVRPGS